MSGKLMDARTIATELGIPLNTAYAWMRKLPKVRPPGLRKVYVYRADLERLMEESTR